MKYAILYDFKGKMGKGTGDYTLEANNKVNAISKLKSILSEVKGLKVREIIEV